MLILPQVFQKNQQDLPYIFVQELIVNNYLIVLKLYYFSLYKERHEFGEIYETILKSLQSAGNAGEFYTPRAVTDFMVEVIKPRLGERIADEAVA